jgi:hypothetical protein
MDEILLADSLSGRNFHSEKYLERKQKIHPEIFLKLCFAQVIQNSMLPTGNLIFVTHLCILVKVESNNFFLSPRLEQCVHKNNHIERNVNVK